MSYLDFNTAEAQSENIPDNETVHIRLALVYGDAGEGNTLHKSKNSDALMLSLEATVTEGKYARRKFWPRFYMGSSTGEMTGGQEQALGISRRALRAIVEAARDVSPTDETPAAIKARQLASLEELDGMECWVVTGIEKGKGGFDDKTVIKRVVPAGKASKAADGANPAAKADKPVSAKKQASW